MVDYWLTTHWPTPNTEPPLSRHVYVKHRRGTLPKPGAMVFFREAIHATDKHGRRVAKVDMHHRGKVTRGNELPKGSGGIIGVATIDGTLRAQRPDDVVFDFGDLREWSVIPCRDFQAARLSLDDLRKLLGKHNVRGLTLWPVADDLGPKLLKGLRR